MPTGDVLLAQAGATELYNPCSDSFLVTDTLPASAGAYRAQAHLLHNNKVIYIGGAISINNGSTDCYLYEAGTWTATGSLNTGRTSFSSTMLPTGEVVVCSGYNASHITNSEIYDPITETWTVSGTVTTPRTRMHSVLLPDGKVLMPGGNEFFNMFNSTEVFDPGMGYDTASVPVITSIAPSSIVISPSTVGYTALTITGTGFQDNNNRKGGEASNSGERNSASNYPIVQVSRIGGHRYDNDFTRYLPFDVDTGNYWDSTSTKVQFPHGIPNELPPGVYAVKVIANGIPSEPAYLNVEVACNVLADFETDTVCEGDSTSFTDLSTGTPTSCWLYDFNDGDSAFSLDPVHLYDSAGFYSVTLVAHSLMGCVDTITKTVVVNPLPTVDAGSDSSICEGDSITLNGSGADSYTWSNGVTDGVAFIPPVGTTTYTVMGTDTNGCANIDSVVVTVNALPNVTANASSQIICEGDSSQLTGFGAVSYTWDNGVTNGDYVLPLTTTTYTVTGTDANNCVNTDSVVVTVNALPNVTANASAQTICEGDSSQLTGFGAASYTWDNGVTDSDYVSPITTTVYTVTGTDANNCSNTDQVTITVNTLPTVDAGPDTTVCDGDTVTLTGSGATIYDWNNGVTDGVPFTPSLGTTTYSVTVVLGLCANSDSVEVTVNPLPTVDAGPDQTVCDGDTVILTGSGASTYTWDNGVTDGVSFTPPLGTMTFTVTGTDANNCVNTDSVIVTVNSIDDASFTYTSGTYCISAADPTPAVTGTPGGVFTASNAVVIDTADGTIDLDASGVGTYMVYYTTAGPCPDVDSVEVTVGQPPPALAISGPGQLCMGSSITLTVQGPGPYMWSTGDTLASITVSPAANTNYWVQ
ncbi:MAG TPA: hypothetical protein EYN71_07740, partial [Flavobacteriales bacterium]|nr:hypothetical protein [Flavobacteriales bacterium]